MDYENFKMKDWEEFLFQKNIINYREFDFTGSLKAETAEKEKENRFPYSPSRYDTVRHGRLDTFVRGSEVVVEEDGTRWCRLYHRFSAGSAEDPSWYVAIYVLGKDYERIFPGTKPTATSEGLQSLGIKREISKDGKTSFYEKNGRVLAFQIKEDGKHVELKGLNWTGEEETFSVIEDWINNNYVSTERKNEYSVETWIGMSGCRKTRLIIHKKHNIFEKIFMEEWQAAFFQTSKNGKISMEDKVFYLDDFFKLTIVHFFDGQFIFDNGKPTIAVVTNENKTLNNHA